MQMDFQDSVKHSWNSLTTMKIKQLYTNQIIMTEKAFNDFFSTKHNWDENQLKNTEVQRKIHLKIFEQ